jgi:hypothetical protein
MTRQHNATKRQHPATAPDSARDARKDAHDVDLRAAISDAVDGAYRERGAPGLFGSPYLTLEATLNKWLVDVWDQVYGRWPCTAEDCPARPAWDVELWERHSVLLQHLEGAVYALVRRRSIAVLEAFAKEFPDAPRPRSLVTFDG